MRSRLALLGCSQLQESLASDVYIGGNMCAVGVSAFFESSSSIVAISRICIYEIVRRSQLDSPWPLVYS
jgi:hypothetical protein